MILLGKEFFSLIIPCGFYPVDLLGQHSFSFVIFVSSFTSTIVFICLSVQLSRLWSVKRWANNVWAFTRCLVSRSVLPLLRFRVEETCLSSGGWTDVKVGCHGAITVFVLAAARRATAEMLSGWVHHAEIIEEGFFFFFYWHRQQFVFK